MPYKHIAFYESSRKLSANYSAILGMVGMFHVGLHTKNLRSIVAAQTAI